ncbi:MAG: hypothetical protein WCY88_11395 [Spongiibacteraceae bacterium]
MSVKRLIDARERRCEYSFQRYLEDIRERLEIIDDPKMWATYSKFLEEKFEQDTN